MSDLDSAGPVVDVWFYLLSLGLDVGINSFVEREAGVSEVVAPHAAARVVEHRKLTATGDVRDIRDLASRDPLGRDLARSDDSPIPVLVGLYPVGKAVERYSGQDVAVFEFTPPSSFTARSHAARILVDSAAKS